MGKKWAAVALVALGIVPAVVIRAGEPETLQVLMHRKLNNAQKVLEGIAMKDFDKINAGGEELIAISKDAEWKVLKTPQYEMSSNEFRRNAEALVQNAKDKNLDAAALSYVEMTLTCVKCHKHVREVRMVRLGGN
jgi:cytochrome c556